MNPIDSGQPTFPARHGGRSSAIDPSHVQSAIAAATASATALGLKVDDALVLQASNRLAIRLLPCDVLVRVAHAPHTAGAEFEVAVARRLAGTESPVAELDPRVEPRVYVEDGFVVTFWVHHGPVSGPEPAPAEYARALERLHAGLRGVDLPAPNFTDRVTEALALVGDPARTPDLAETDRELLDTILRTRQDAIARHGAAEQLLHGEPHPGNVLNTSAGLLFIDLETCCRGPVEFDIAHLPQDASEWYPHVDQDLLDECRTLTLAMVAAWRWDRDDRFPNGREMGMELLSQLRHSG